jgi:amino acid permease
MSSDSYNSKDPCSKKFTKTGKLLHGLHTFHNVFTAVIWVIIIILIIDYYKHILPHESHEVILWFEFVSYTIFLAVPIFASAYKHYKITKCRKGVHFEDIALDKSDKIKLV